MAKRMVKRADIKGEEGVAVAFGYSSLGAALLIGTLEAVTERIPFLPLVITLLTWPAHRIVLATDKNSYVFRSRPFHRPGAKLGEYPVAPGTASLGHGLFSRRKITFSDGQAMWHSWAFGWRVKAVEEAANAQST